MTEASGQSHGSRRRRCRGVTLLELMITLAVLAILVAAAYTNYRQHTLRAQRTEAMAALLRLHAEQERFYTRNGNRYTSDLTALGYPVPSDAPTENGRYLISVDSGADASGFTARATAHGHMSADEECRQFIIDAQGLRAAAPDPHRRCW